MWRHAYKLTDLYFFLFVFVYPLVQILLSNSYWFIPLCLLFGLGISALFYFFKSSDSVIPKNIRIGLFIVRAILASLLAFLLLNPLSKQKVTELENPVIFFLQDNSKSITLTKDSAYYKGQYLEQWSQLQKDLGDKFQLRHFTFSDLLIDGNEINFDGAETNLDAALKELEIIGAGINVGAVIIASDGIYTKGNTPLNRLGNFKFPFYTIGLGDTTTRKDWYIRNVITNKIAFTNSQLPVDIQIGADMLKNSSGNLKLFFNGKKLHEQAFHIQNNKSDLNAQFYIQTQSPGLYPIKAELSVIDGELNIKNNQFTVFVEVSDTRKKIALVSEGPHPDLGAIKHALSRDENFEIEIKSIQEFNVDENYNLVILHSIPSNNTATSTLFTSLKNKQTPLWFIVGEKTSAFAFNQVQSGLNIQSIGGKTEDVRLALQAAFTGFTVSENMQQLWKMAPPLQTLPGTIKGQNNAQILAYKKVGSIETMQPLWAFTNNNDTKYSVLFGEGLWRIRLFDYEQNNSFELFDEWIQKTVQLLAASEDKSRFRVDAKNRYEQNEPVFIRAELYNEALENINTPDVQLEILDSSKVATKYTFSKKDNYYQLNVGLMQPGVYSYKAQTQLSGKNYIKQGNFIVHSEALEYSQLKADHSLLMQMSTQTKGEFFTPNQMHKIVDSLEARKDIHVKSRTFTDFSMWIDWKWLFFIVVLTFCIEWFVRKWYGTY